MITPPSKENVDGDEAKLDVLFAVLADAYQALAIPAQAIEKINKKIHDENRKLTDQDLEWLAAAGTDFKLKRHDEND
ncbi:MAG: hypothetical protein JWQ23_1493 [Herminiimonas sp.]|nr:hypothetical protein [Herminiimonas sp.]